MIRGILALGSMVRVREKAARKIANFIERPPAAVLESGLPLARLPAGRQGSRVMPIDSGLKRNHVRVSLYLETR
jgi:hypothetical protein